MIRKGSGNNDILIKMNRKILSDNWMLNIFHSNVLQIALLDNGAWCFNEVERGVYWFHLVRLFLCPSVEIIVCALYLQYSLDPFHICTSYQATSEGVSRVAFGSKFNNLKFWRIRSICKIWLCLLLTWDSIWLNRMGNHEAVGVSSERRRSSRSSFNYNCTHELIVTCVYA